MEQAINIAIVAALSYVQNVSYTLASRARNRSSRAYYIIASVFANLIWFFTLKLVVIDYGIEQMSWELLLVLLSYIIGNVLGSLTGMWSSEKIERWLGASTDDHLKKG